MMARGKRSKKSSLFGQDGINFVITLVTVSVVFIFFGYVLGQYAVRVLRDEGVTTINRVQGQQETLSREIARSLPEVPPASSPPGPAPSAPTSSPTSSPSPSSEAEPGAADEAAPPPETAEPESSEIATETHTDLEDQDPRETGTFYRVQVGAYSQMANAERMRDTLLDAGYPAMITSGPLYRVQTGAFASRENAQRYAQELRDQGFEAVISQ